MNRRVLITGGAGFVGSFLGLIVVLWATVLILV